MRRWTLLGTIAGAVCAGAFVNCDGDGPLGDLAEQCGVTCPAEGVRDGNASISGIIEIDAFFGAILDLNAAAHSVRDGIDADLKKIALSLNLDNDTEAQAIANAAAVYINQHTSGGLHLAMSPPTCEASVEVAARAAAECDVEVDLGSAQVRCQGTCQAEAGVAVDCGAGATLTCTGTAPNFQCAGTCTGECQVDGSVGCEGICRGECMGNCSVTDSMGNCAGECDAECNGTCELRAGGTCEGECTGSCTYEPGGAMCDAAVEAQCVSMGQASVECEGQCEGTADPPAVKPECEATVKAKADASVECSPPAISPTWQWSAATANDPVAQAEFRAWVAIISKAAASMRSKGVKGDILLNGFAAMSDSAEGAVEAGAEAALDGNLKARIGAGCALDELDSATRLLNDSADLLAGSLQDIATIFDEGGLGAPGQGGESRADGLP